MFIKNKRGDIPVTFLVIGVILICALTIASFSFSSFVLETSFTGTEAIEEINAQIEQYNFYLSHGFSDEEIEELLDIRDDNDGSGKYLYSELNAGSVWGTKGLLGKEKIALKIKYYLKK